MEGYMAYFRQGRQLRTASFDGIIPRFDVNLFVWANFTILTHETARDTLELANTVLYCLFPAASVGSNLAGWEPLDHTYAITPKTFTPVLTPIAAPLVAPRSDDAKSLLVPNRTFPANSGGNLVFYFAITHSLLGRFDS